MILYLLLPEIHYSLVISQVGQLTVDVLHAALEQPEGRNTYVGLLFIDRSHVYNTFLRTKLGQIVSICTWVYDLLSGRP